MTETTEPQRPPFDARAAAAWIVQTARNSGLVVDAAALQVAAVELAGAVERDRSGSLVYQDEAAAGAFRIEDGRIVEVPVQQFIADLLLKHATPAAPKPSARTAQADATPVPAKRSAAPSWAKRGTGVISEFARALADKEDAALAKEAATWPNPWAPNQINRTRQQIILNKNPALAVQYKSQAGV